MELSEYLSNNSTEVEKFKELLKEKGLQKNSEYDKFLPKMLYDERYKTIPLKIRKPLFDECVKNYSVDFQKNKDEHKKILQGYIKELLEDYDKIDGFKKKPDYIDFRKHYANDRRLIEALSAYDVQKYFNAKAEVVQKRTRDEKARARFKFEEMIKEYLDKAKNVDRDLKWKDFKKELKKDERYEIIESSRDREQIFETVLNQYISESKKRRVRNRSRERDEKKTHFSSTEDSNDRIKKMNQLNSKEDFKGLLLEKIKTYDMSYDEAKKLISSDPRYDSGLDSDTRRRVYEDYVKQRQREAISKFRELLIEKRDHFEPETTFQQACEIFIQDKRFLQVSVADAEKFFDGYMEKVRDEALLGFERFLMETPLLNKDSPLEGEEFDKLLVKLSSDPRYERTQFIADKRFTMIKQRILDLKEEFKRNQMELEKESKFADS